jgi:nitrite reductase (NADH) small subunit
MTGAREIIVGPLAAIPAGEGRTFDVGGERIAVFRNRADGVFAVQANCPHKGGPLADGLLGGSTLICPLHSWKFDLSNGEALMGSCGLTVYPARLDERQRIIVSL